MQMGVQRVPPDAAADGEAIEARNGGCDLQPVVKVVVTCGPAEDDAVGGSPAALGRRSDRDRVVVTVEALHLPQRRRDPVVLQILDDLHGCLWPQRDVVAGGIAAERGEVGGQLGDGGAVGMGRAAVFTGGHQID
jgi:hypothetical protein